MIWDWDWEESKIQIPVLSHPRRGHPSGFLIHPIVSLGVGMTVEKAAVAFMALVTINFLSRLWSVLGSLFAVTQKFGQRSDTRTLYDVISCSAATEGLVDQRGPSKIGTTVGADLPCSPVSIAWASRLASPLTRFRVLPAGEASQSTLV